ncbi:hypothetical protein HPB48_009434 [Haemaphysalis longicornis]|uniref:CARD domain-containing protein n=1 Tax=Haemaphysalis longicornis TaxID=44386 RepID=A0A9J6GD25_HAELO|nr:hypothetical protein HPB48_009434 [Haemaphysalis longicornis]
MACFSCVPADYYYIDRCRVQSEQLLLQTTKAIVGIETVVTTSGYINVMWETSMVIQVTQEDMHCHFQDTVENKVRRLLDILCTKGSNGYAVFIRALEDDGNYGWIAKKLQHDA